MSVRVSVRARVSVRVSVRVRVRVRVRILSVYDIEYLSVTQDSSCTDCYPQDKRRIELNGIEQS